MLLNTNLGSTGPSNPSRPTATRVSVIPDSTHIPNIVNPIFRQGQTPTGPVKTMPQQLPAAPPVATPASMAEFLNSITGGGSANSASSLATNPMDQQHQISQTAIAAAAQAQAEAAARAQQQQIMQAAMARLSAASAPTTSSGGGYTGGSPQVPAGHQYHGGGNVNLWVEKALNILGLGDRFAPGIETMISHESGGDPNIVNHTDINAQEGHPSEGLMQTIPGTFAEYVLNRPHHAENIDNPIDNIIAGVRYAIANYGKHMVLAGGRRDANGNYLGY